MALNARRGVRRESAAVVPRFHFLTVLRVDRPASHERPQEAAADLGLHRLGVVRVQVVYRDEPRAGLPIGLENAVDDADREVSVLVRRGAEPMNESHRAGSRLWACPRAVRTQVPLDGIKEDAQSAVESLAVMREVIA